VIGAAFVIFDVVNTFWKDRWFWLLGPVAAVAAIKCAVTYVPRYYRRRFGWVERSQRSNLWSFRPLVGFFILLAIIPVVLLTSYDLGLYVNTKGSGLLALAVWLTMMCYEALERPQLLTLRRAYFLPIFLGVVFVVLYPIYHPMSAAQLAVWRRLNDSLLGASFVVMGFCDHILLVRLAPNRVTPDEEGGRDDK
jgi:hypothetical protein